MKKLKKLNIQQKKCLSAYYLNTKKWALLKETEFYLVVVNKETGKRKTLDKFRR